MNQNQFIRRIAQQRGSKKATIAESVTESIHIFWEFLTGFRFASKFGKAVSFFGSSREMLPEKYYNDCEELAARLSKRGLVVATGGGEGIMEAANRGTTRVNGESVGINILLDQEQKNRFLKHTKTFKYFFSRRAILFRISDIFIFFPGGYGTLDELFEMLTLVQTKKIKKPTAIVLYDKEFWGPLVSFLEKNLTERYKTIDKEDTLHFSIINSVDEAERHIEEIIEREEGRVMPF